MSFIDIKIKILDRGFDREMWMTSCTESAREGFWEIWKGQDLRTRLSGLAAAKRICALRALHEMGGRLKSQNRKNMYLSPYVEEPLNSKVIKSFVPELRSRKCFSYFGIPMFYVYIYIYIWTFYVRFTHSHIMIMVQGLDFGISFRFPSLSISLIVLLYFLSPPHLPLSLSLSLSLFLILSPLPYISPLFFSTTLIYFVSGGMKKIYP